MLRQQKLLTVDAECLFHNLFRAAFCSELQFLVCLKIFNFESTKVARYPDGLCRKNRNERREKENENDKTVHQ